MNDDETTCPECAETIKSAAKVCKHCGFRLPPPPPPVDRARDIIEPAPVATWDKPPPNQGPSWWDRNFDNGRHARFGCLAFLLTLCAAVLMLMSYCSNQRAEADKQQKAADSAAAAEQDKENAQNKRKGFHCLSMIDGSNTKVVDAVKRSLRNPSSFEHIETNITPVDKKGVHHLIMSYRAQNGFGGMTVGRVIARVDPATCNARIDVSE